MNRTLLIVAVLAAGCDGVTTAPQPIVSVLKRTPDDCYALMTPSAPVSTTLGISGICSYSVVPTLLASVEAMEIVVDYGPDVPFSATTPAPPPTIAVTIDGQAADLAIELSGEQRVGSRAFFVAALHTPSVATEDMRITAGVNAGFQTEVPDVFVLVEPTISLAFAECQPGNPCVLQGATGFAHLEITLPGDVPLTVGVHAKIDGVAQPDPVPPVTTTPVADNSETIVAIPVPAVHDGAQWQLDAELPGGRPTTLLASIVAPGIAAALSCGSTCNLHPGNPVGLTITAPEGISPAQALVTTTLDGVPQLIAAPVALQTGAVGTSTGQLALVAPSAGAWQIDVTVAGYPAPSIVTTVQ